MAMSIIAAGLPILHFSSHPPPPPFFASIQPTTSIVCPLLPWGKTSRATKTAVLIASATGNSWPPRGGTGLLERPSLDQSQFDPLPQPQEGGNEGHSKDKVGLGYGDSYRVLLIDNDLHTQKLVEKALPQVVPSVTVSNAIELFHESRVRGVAVVIVTVKEHAEFYAEMMIRCGLQSAIEPDSNMA